VAGAAAHYRLAMLRRRKPTAGAALPVFGLTANPKSAAASSAFAFPFRRDRGGRGIILISPDLSSRGAKDDIWCSRGSFQHARNLLGFLRILREVQFYL
jgi:hypothetical protein